MKLRLIIALLLITAGIGSVSAQKTEAKQINMIKLDGRYLYGEATMPTEAEAKEAADITLINYINDKLKEHHIDRRLGLDGLEQTQYITVKRGANIRVFAYVECSVYGIPSAASPPARDSRHGRLKRLRSFSELPISTAPPSCSMNFVARARCSLSEAQKSALTHPSVFGWCLTIT